MVWLSHNLSINNIPLQANLYKHLVNLNATLYIVQHLMNLRTTVYSTDFFFAPDLFVNKPPAMALVTGLGFTLVCIPPVMSVWIALSTFVIVRVSLPVVMIQMRTFVVVRWRSWTSNVSPTLWSLGGDRRCPHPVSRSRFLRFPITLSSFNNWFPSIKLLPSRVFNRTLATLSLELSSTLSLGGILSGYCSRGGVFVRHFCLDNCVNNSFVPMTRNELLSFLDDHSFTGQVYC